jgi:hypothetical protein
MTTATMLVLLLRMLDPRTEFPDDDGGGATVAPPSPPPPSPPPPPAAPPPRRARRDWDPEALRRATEDDPPIDELRRAATALAAAEPSRARSMIQRARWAGLLPEVRVRVDRRFGRSESLDVPSVPLDDPPPVGLDTVDEVRYEGRASWDLSRIVFNPDELAAHSEAMRMADARREVESLVIRLYFERRRLKVEALAADAREVGPNLRREVRMQELEAELDALTGGAFSRRAASRGRAAVAPPEP